MFNFVTSFTSTFHLRSYNNNMNLGFKIKNDKILFSWPPLKVMEIPCKLWIQKSRLYLTINSPHPLQMRAACWEAVAPGPPRATANSLATSFLRCQDGAPAALVPREGAPHPAAPPLAGRQMLGWCQAHLRTSHRHPLTSRTAAALQRPWPVGTPGAENVTPARLQEAGTPLEEGPRGKLMTDST